MAGCGRFFEGNPQLMHSALIEKLAKLPPTTVSSVPDIFTARTRSFREGNVFSPICLFIGGFLCFQTCSFAPPDLSNLFTRRALPQDRLAFD